MTIHIVRTGFNELYLQAGEGIGAQHTAQTFNSVAQMRAYIKQVKDKMGAKHTIKLEGF